MPVTAVSSPPTLTTDAERAVAIAEELLRASERISADASRRARRRDRRMAAIVGNPAAQAFTMQLTDEVARITDPRRAARRFADLVGAAALHDLGVVDRTLLRAGARVAPLLPAPVMHLVERRLRSESNGVILPAEPAPLGAHLAHRRADGVRSNVNVLGEAILSEAEADHRLELVLEQLARPDVSYVSVKLSAISAHVNPLAFEHTVEEVAGAVRRLYRAAMSHSPTAFVNLDMEEFRDLELTATLFRRVLDEPEFHLFSAGIVLQAYLPDSHEAARQLAEWARARVDAGRAPIKVRLVKGANLAMELVEAELRGWPAAPFSTKHEVDASYKRLLEFLLDARYDDAVRVGLASHNLFDVAWGLVARERLEQRGHADRLDFEMLEGMAPAQAWAVKERVGSLLLYSPIVAHHDFPAAIAYLVRRLDENTAPENFLTALFTIRPGSTEFIAQAARFGAAVAAAHEIDLSPRRTQDRRMVTPANRLEAPFVNEPDTDFSLPANRDWIAQAIAEWQPAARPTLIDRDGVDAAVATACAALSPWSERADRAELVNRVGDVIAARRGEILVAMAHEAAKTIAEGDPEVSEAVDFARYYARSVAHIDELAAAGVPSAPLGVVVVAPPWNFPFAIPMGGVLAALAAGNTVVLKPAPQTVMTGLLVAECCWAAGIPRDALQFVDCREDEAGPRLITHPDVAAVILTGANATARRFLDWRPDLRLHAETSGKNAMVITATADLDAALRDLVRSAFGHAGQKCSAASLAIVEASLYDDPMFRRRLHDAVVSLRVGDTLDPATDIGPLIDAPTDRLLRAFTELDEGETWLVEPVRRSGDGRSWTPGVRLGVRPGSWFAMTECFGPALGVMRADDLDHAIALQNATAFGLTAGLHALDPAEIERWADRVEAGNLYVNRGMTGAIVGRHPFGGWKQSVVGPTVKAGGPEYVASLRHWPAIEARPDLAARFAEWFATHGRAELDPTGLRAERNALRWRSLPRGVALRLGVGATREAAAIARTASSVTGTPLVLSTAADETDTAFADRLTTLGVDRLRIVGEVDDAVRRVAHERGIAVDERPFHAEPTIELPRWLREQALSRTLHRHGRIAPNTEGTP